MAKGIILGQEPNIDDKLKEINSKFNNYLPLSGGTMNGQINMNNKKITGLSNAVNNTDAVNLQQLNTIASPLKWVKLTSVKLNDEIMGNRNFNLSYIPSLFIIQFNGTFKELSNTDVYCKVQFNEFYDEGQVVFNNVSGMLNSSLKLNISMVVTNISSYNPSQKSFTVSINNYFTQNQLPVKTLLKVGKNTWNCNFYNRVSFNGTISLFALM